MNENEAPSPHNPKFVRSPSFPILPIDEAINRARTIYEQDRRSLTPFEAVITHLGYTATTKKGGRPARAVSTLKQYRLLDEVESQYRISDLAFKVLELPTDSPEREKLVREAAFSPKIFQKILRYYNGELPSDAALRSYLILTEKFNPDSIPDFIRVLRRTIELVNPIPQDYNSGESGAGIEAPPGDNENAGKPSGKGASGSTGSSGHGQKPPLKLNEGVMYSINIEVLNDGQINVNSAGALTSETFKLMSDIYGLKEKHEVKPDPTPPVQQQQGASFSEAFEEIYKEKEQE